MSRPRNLIVAQSGGPSPVINNSLRGIIETARQMSEIGTVYGARHGIEGVLKEELLDLTAQDPAEISLLQYTPAAGSIGTCRYKLKPAQTEDFARTIEVLRAHDIGYFLYIGGNDSMDTAHKIAAMARERDLDLIAVGVPKTIDNDVGDSEFKLVDHTPGYGSTAKYWMHAVQNANEENNGSCPADPVLVMQAIGRKIGYIPAAARLADPERKLPLQIYLAESPCTLPQLADNVNAELKKSGRCMVVISEGFDVGDIGAAKDSFGHTSFGASQNQVAQVVVNYLNKVGLAAKGSARCNIPGTDQRHSMAYASSVDLEEAFLSGQKAAQLAAAGEGGFMATILREPGATYKARYDKVPLEKVAAADRTFPKQWIAKNGCDVTDDFLRYARPLVGEGMISLPMENGRQRLARLKPIYADQKLPKYVPQADRSKGPGG
jgi:6-phosphofructokinase